MREPTPLTGSHALIDSRDDRWSRRQPLLRGEHSWRHCFHFPREEAEAQRGQVQIYTHTASAKGTDCGGLRKFSPVRRLPEGGDGNQDGACACACASIQSPTAPPSQPGGRVPQQGEARGQVRPAGSGAVTVAGTAGSPGTLGVRAGLSQGIFPGSFPSAGPPPRPAPPRAVPKQ